MDTAPAAPAPRPGVLRRVGRLIRRILVTIAGILVTAIGIVLLPLPGPGWLIIFGGLGILSTEYAWAKRLLHSVRNFAVRWENWAKRQPLAVRIAMIVIGILIVAAIAYAVYWYYFVR